MMKIVKVLIWVLISSGWLMAIPGLDVKSEKVTGTISKAFWVDYGGEIISGWVDEGGKFKEKKLKLKPFWVVQLGRVEGIFPKIIKRINFHSEHTFPVQQAPPVKKGRLILLLRITGSKELNLTRGKTLEIKKFAYFADEYGGALGYGSVRMKEE